jgi:serine phosphatase RsbU (regulator of sigma subunit)
LQKLPPEQRRRLFDAALGKPAMAVKNLLGAPDRRLGYALAAARPDARYVVYGEGSLPRNRRARIASDSAFADLDYSLYLGTKADPDNLLASSRSGGHLPETRQGSQVVPFGQSKFLLVLAPQRDLGGALLARLPWLLALFGTLLSLGAALLVERLARRREAAERLAELLGDAADQNARLYADQREIAQTLQHSLLPERLPSVPGVVAVGRYEAGVSGLEVGGDWYDVLPVGPHRLFFSVGDVCGRGLPAAAAMAALRFSIRAYAVEGNSPAQILDKLAHLVLVARPDQFATVACGVIDTERHEVTMASAGHLDFLVVDESGARFVETPVGTPLGVASARGYSTKTMALPSSGTILGFTDGLVERRGESLDVGLQRLKSHIASPSEPLDALVARLVDDLAPGGSEDDISILGVRWSFDPVTAGAIETAGTGGAR